MKKIVDMKKIKVNHHKFTRLVRLFDKAIGTIEPLARKIYFYTESDNLMVYGTDGCLSVEFHLGEMEPLDDFYVIPLDDLKLLLRERSEDVFMTFGTTFQISKGTEILSILHPISSDPRKKVDILTSHTVDAKQFQRTLDLGSILSREGQMTFLGCKNGQFFSASEDFGHIGIAFMDFNENNFAVEIPYESVRHLVKMLEVLKEDMIEIGYSRMIGMRFSDGKMNICSDEATNMEQMEELVNFDNVDFEIPVKVLKEGATLSSRFQRKNGGRGYLELSDTIRFTVLSQVSAYEYSYPIQWGSKMRVPIIPRKIQQFFSRIHEKYVITGSTSEYLVFKSMQALMLIKKNST